MTLFCFCLTLSFQSVFCYAYKGIIFNELKPFSSDGCSVFFDGYPFINNDKWLKCCIAHDISYWQGGTERERERADSELSQCLNETGADFISKFIRLGVRPGGYRKLPTTWRWGYGWVLDRGYAPLSLSELEQVGQLLEGIPYDLNEIEITSSPVIPIRDSLTGDYCLDISMGYIYRFLGHSPFYVELVSQSEIKGSGSGWKKNIIIKVRECNDVFSFDFLLLQPRACEKISLNEVLVRSYIRPMRSRMPRSCN